MDIEYEQLIGQVQDLVKNCLMSRPSSKVQLLINVDPEENEATVEEIVKHHLEVY